MVIDAERKPLVLLRAVPRLIVSLVLATSVLVGCGGGDDDAAAPAAGGDDAAVVTSDDGKATLTLPPGVDADGITVEAVEVEGAAAAYELLPSGTTFEEPATLTVTDVDAPAGQPMAIGIIASADGDATLVDTTTTYEARDDHSEPATATVELQVPHFSTASLGYRVGADTKPIFEVGAALPRSVVVGTPFDASTLVVRHGRSFTFHHDDNEYEVEFGDARLSGTLTARNATPEEINDVPPQTAIGDRFAAKGTFTCARRGWVDVTYRVRIAADFVLTSPNGSTIEEPVVFNHRLTTGTPCRAAPTTTTTSSTTTTTAAPVKPVVKEIHIDLHVPVTTYSAIVNVPADTYVDYEWSMTGEDCGTPKTPWRQNGESVTWSHSDAPPDSCHHASPEHEVTITLTVTAGGGESTACTFEGTENDVLVDPPCV
jgi:hypothetical protein